MQKLVLQSLLGLIMVAVILPGLASATDIHLHGSVNYYSPYYNHSYDVVEVYDQNNNRLAVSNILLGVTACCDPQYWLLENRGNHEKD